MEAPSIVVGMDYHKNIIAVCVKYRDGRLFHNTKFPNTTEAVLKWWRRMPDEMPITVCLESTDAWTAIYYELRELGATVKIANCYRLAAFAKAGKKSDKRDAEMLCDLEIAGLFPSITIPEDWCIRMRKVLRLRANLVKKRTASINQARAVLRECRLKPTTKSLWSKTALRWLRNEAAEQVEWENAVVIMTLADEIEFLTGKIAELEKCINEFSFDNEVARTVRSLPGFGPILSSFVAVELKGIDNFENRRQMTAYGGTVPMNFSSDGKERQWRMSKSCNRYLQWAFIEAAMSASRYNPIVRKWYEKQCMRIDPKRARIKVAHKMQRLLYYLLKHPGEELHLERCFRVKEDAA